MTIAAAAVSSLLAGLLVLSASIKLTRREPYVQGYLRVGVPEDKLNYLAAILLAGAAGLILGLVWDPIGIAAAAALVVYFLVAIASHIRADDARNLPNPVAMLLLAAASLALQLASL
jgi:DoxX-like family